MAKIFLYLIISCLGTIVASEANYIITPSQSQSIGDHYGSNADSLLTLSQFVNKSGSIANLTNDTKLIFSTPGYYNLESELVVENVHSFSMLAWPSFSLKAVIVCHRDARFEFRNVSIVNVSGLEFIGCFENHVVSVGQFQLEYSTFLGRDMAIVRGAVLTIEESTANLDRVAFKSIIDQRSSTSQELQINCATTISTTVIGISLKRSTIGITQSWFEGNNIAFGGAILFDEFGSNIMIESTTFVNNSANDLYAACCCYGNITSGHLHGIVYAANSHGSTVRIYNSKFLQNVGTIIFGENCDMLITHTEFIDNRCGGHRFAIIEATNANLVVIHSTVTNNTGCVLDARYTNVSISHCNFIGNNGFTTINVLHGMITNIDHSNFISNNGSMILQAEKTSVSINHSEFISNCGSTIIDLHDGEFTSIEHSKFVNNTSEFINNTVTNSLIFIDGVMIAINLSKFVNNRARYVVYIRYYTTAENIRSNMFINNKAVYEVFVDSDCRPGLRLSLGSSRCIKCSENWDLNLIGILIATFVAGIALVVFMLALNMTVAVGTLNGIFFYANIVAANADTYFWPFTTNFITVFISWLNLDIGFDVCFFPENEGFTIDPSQVYKALIQLAFPAYVIFIVIIVIMASEYSSKFSKILAKGNPIAVLATMVLLSYAKFFNVILTSCSLLYSQPGYGSRNLDVRRLGSILMMVGQTDDTSLKAFAYFLLVISMLVLLLGVTYTALVFSWQWLLLYQDKVIFKWVKYQKLLHFLEPYHAPYTAQYRYWTGLLLLVRLFLYLTSLVNFSLDPRVDLMTITLVVGGLILLKGVITKRVYKNWPLDVMETAIYFNLIVFSALTWYNLDFGGNQIAVAYTSVMIIFIHLLGVSIFHVLRYTRLYKCSLVTKAFKWTSSKLMEKHTKSLPTDDAPEELDGFRLERSVAGDQKLSNITYSVIEVSQPTQNQEEN